MLQICIHVYKHLYTLCRVVCVDKMCYKFSVHIRFHSDKPASLLRIDSKDLWLEVHFKTIGFLIISASVQ